MFKERDRIQKLIRDTIITLCNSGLKFDTELSVEGLLGITLDHKDILLVNINEIIKTQHKGRLVDEYSPADDKPPPVSSNTSCRSTPTHKNGAGVGHSETTMQDADHSIDDMFKGDTASEIVDEVAAVTGQDSQESYDRIHSGANSSDADYKYDNSEQVIVVKEEPRDYDGCSMDQHPCSGPAAAAAQQHCSTPIFPGFAQDNFPHLSSTEMSSTKPTASRIPVAGDVDFNTVSHMYTDHLKDEPAELLNQNNGDMNCWFNPNPSSVANFDMSGSSLASMPNPQHQLWAPKQANSSGLSHTSMAEQLSELASTTQREQTGRLMMAQLRKHRCPQCSFTSDKLFNVRRHINKRHTGQPSMPMPHAGAGIGTASGGTTDGGVTAPLGPVTVKAETSATSLAGDIEVVSPPMSMCVNMSLFKCLHCPFTSKKKFNVKRHIRQQHDQLPVTCDRCNVRCRNQYYLQWYHKPKCPSRLDTTV